MVTGRIERGIDGVGDEIEIVGIKDDAKTVCTGVEMFRKLLDRGEPGTTSGCSCAWPRGGGARPGAVQAGLDHAAQFSAETYVLTKEEGGAAPFF